VYDLLASLLHVDIICINQNDDEEKSQQVAMMEKIYAIAQHPIIYLDPLKRPTEALLVALVPDLYNTCQSSKSYGGPLSINTRLADLLCRPWFDRVWVFQELVFSRNPWEQYGRLRLQWEHLYGSVTLLRSTQDERSSTSLVAEQQRLLRAYNTFSEMQRVRRKYRESRFDKGPNLSFRELVISRQGLGATDPRDFLFSHAGFASDAPNPMITVDYNKSCAQVYSDFARYEIEKSGNFNILSRVPDMPLDERMKGLPSWAPDWSKSAPSSELFLNRTVANSRMTEPGIVKFEQSHFWIQDPPILAHISSQLDIVVDLSVELSVDLMPARKRRNFEAKFAAMMKDAQSQQSLSDEDYEKVFCEVYETWHNILGRDVLPESSDDRPSKIFFSQPGVKNIRDLKDLPSVSG
jgi:hypothetical protein